MHATDATPPTHCAHYLLLDGRDVASTWLPITATLDEVRADCLTMTSIIVHTESEHGELPFEREGKIRKADGHALVSRGEYRQVAY
ncbi:hypothetical protein E4T66_18465 [Sinimarinibacterium sp. CAU 1509]|uniref:hypothetical protein n=1 Tax=Sinimarinibacterium sp. CAU 1509 TaxID=2562283 RepID=UPI0010AC92B7|nr:hypothetical protein [Sinimarinibacterium sp. CAU 1509]TJY57391.1 hypothetical protein E4T66_18465 [Sinimarinibacterium sp. CAU 1509]